MDNVITVAILHKNNKKKKIYENELKLLDYVCTNIVTIRLIKNLEYIFLKIKRI